MLYRLQARADRCRPEMQLASGIGMVPAPRGRERGRYLWAQLLARIFGAFALQCSRCGRRVHMVGSTTEPAPVRQILEHLGGRELHR